MVKKRLIVGFGTVAAIAVSFAAPAGAHVTADPDTAPANSYATVFFQVPHGCNGSATTKIAMQIPDGVTSVKPEAIASWVATTSTTPLATPVTAEGREVTTRVNEVSWTGGPLSNDQFQRFGVSMKLPDSKAGTELAFPVIQTCVQGTTSWTDIAKSGQPEPDHPAPMLTLSAAASSDQHGSSMTSDTTDTHDSTSPWTWVALALSAVSVAVAAGTAIGLTRKTGNQTPAA
ncbi:MAG: YcnI family protein [Acidimicrobiia bacterium]